MALIIGVTGYISSGKDTVAEYLQKKGFFHISLSNILREDLKRLGMEVTRDNLIELGNEIRTKHGGGILAERAMGRMEPDKNYVVTSIGRVDEIMTLRNHKNFKLIFVDAPQKKRFEWFVSRKREEEPLTYNQFMKLEKFESKGSNAQHREFDNCKKKADIILNNNGTLEELKDKVEKILKDVEKRPDWDEYFFGIMDAVAKRATCDRGRAGCIIVKNKKILATGYVGSPIGLEHCDEAGHILEKTHHIEGEERWHCVRTAHAEQNAVAQAARHGVSIDGATIYVQMEPCLMCAKLLINSGINEIICRKQYHGAHLSREFLEKANVKLTVREKVLQTYDKM